MYERILVALDGSPLAAAAIPHAAAFAKCFAAELTLLRAIPTLGELAQGAVPDVTSHPEASVDVIASRAEEEEAAAADAYLRGVRAKLADEGVKAGIAVKEGRPSAAILDAARALNSDLIVLTAYGGGGAHTRAGRNVFGGTADQVLRNAHVPVLVIRP
jgi:nucleotide-binding universal stress UspA family protein